MDGKQLLAGFRSIDRSLCHHLVGKDLYPSARNLEVLRFPESALFPHSRKSESLHFSEWKTASWELGVSEAKPTRKWCERAAPQVCLCGVAHRVLGVQPEDAVHFHKTTDTVRFSPQLLPGEEHVRFLLEHPAAEVRPLRAFSCCRP